MELRPSAVGRAGMVVLALLLIVFGGAMVAAATVIDQWADPNGIAAGIVGIVIAASGVLGLVVMPRALAPAWLTFRPDAVEYVGRQFTLSVLWQDVEWLYLCAPGKLSLLGVRWSPLVQLIIRLGPEAAAANGAARGRVGRRPGLVDRTRVVMFWAGKESKQAVALGCDTYGGGRFHGPRL
ncbi:hypothetical protein SAMN04488554_3657 [Ruania alba]|uniref:Uncharacterized protein n=1 Tax=Ruania alba TaxID=648782 RepID=A0A1H5MUT1_9MICO|nr:hypothetical protein SAMN04488554_3657 [Ruania alba]